MLEQNVWLKLLRHNTDTDAFAGLRIIAITTATRKDCMESSMPCGRGNEDVHNCLEIPLSNKFWTCLFLQRADHSDFQQKRFSFMLDAFMMMILDL